MEPHFLSQCRFCCIPMQFALIYKVYDYCSLWMATLKGPKLSVFIHICEQCRRINKNQLSWRRISRLSPFESHITNSQLVRLVPSLCTPHRCRKMNAFPIICFLADKLLSDIWKRPIFNAQGCHSWLHSMTQYARKTYQKYVKVNLGPYFKQTIVLNRIHASKTRKLLQCDAR